MVFVVYAWTKNNLRTNLNIVLRKNLHPTKTETTSIISQHFGTKMRTVGMNAHINRRQPLFKNSLKIRLSESCQRGEVAKQKTQPIVVVLQIQTATHSLRQLVNETELAMVIACVNAIEHGTRN